MLWIDFCPRWLQIFLHWTKYKTDWPLRLTFCSLVSVNNLPKSTTTHSPLLTLLETLASYLMNASPSMTRSHLSSNIAITIFVNFAVYVHTSIPKQLPPSPVPLFTPSLITVLQLSLSQPAQVSDHPAPTDPELSSTCCCQSSRIQSHHSHPSVSALVKDNWVHWMQAPLTYRHSSHNHPTFIFA